MSKIRVDLGSRSYDIIVGFNNLGKIGQHIKKLEKKAPKFKRKIAIITDGIVDQLYGKIVRSSLKGFQVFTFKVPAGEKHKTLAVASALYDLLVINNFCRDDCVLALGGGVIGDLAGFVAGTYMRGIDVIQVPTTLLAQVDASIGGKTAVDHKSAKNMVGVFHQPRLVFIDVMTLRSLPHRELRTGFAEVIKYGIIKDPTIFKKLESDPKADRAFWMDIVARSARIKADVVSRDEKEKTGLRLILNFGHTIGHAIEASSSYLEFTHGEAVALGMVAASFIAYQKNMIDKSVFLRIKNLIKTFGLPVKVKFDANRVAKLLKYDKKVKAGKLRFVLPIKIGKVAVRDDIDVTLLKKALKEIKA